MNHHGMALRGSLDVGHRGPTATRSRRRHTQRTKCAPSSRCSPGSPPDPDHRSGEWSYETTRHSRGCRGGLGPVQLDDHASVNSGQAWGRPGAKSGRSAATQASRRGSTQGTLPDWPKLARSLAECARPVSAGPCGLADRSRGTQSFEAAAGRTREHASRTGRRPRGGIGDRLPASSRGGRQLRRDRTMSRRSWAIPTGARRPPDASSSCHSGSNTPHRPP